MNALPRLLFITAEPPHTGGAGSLYFHRLLRDYPKDRLLVVTSQRIPTPAGTLDCRYEHVPLAVDRLQRTRLWSARTSLRVLGGARLLPLRRIDAVLAGFQPDLAVTLMQDSWYYDYAARYARARSLPLVVFVHDLPEGFEKVGAWLRPQQHRRDAAIYRQAARCLCVSEPMATHLAAVLGRPPDVLPPPRADEPVMQSPDACAHLKKPGRLTLGYAGGLHYGYGEQLLRLLPACRATHTTLRLYTAAPRGRVVGLAAAKDAVELAGRASAPEETWHRLLRECDAVIQPYLEPPGGHSLQYATHFPIKLGECLSLGLPLLITGPAHATGMAWCLARPGCALTVGDGTDPQSALVRLRDDPALRIALARRAQTAATAFDPAPLRQRLRSVLHDAVAAR